MDKFSKVQIEPDSLGEEEVYSSNYIDIVKYKGNDVIKDKDSVAILPYFKYEGTLLMLSEYLTAYQYRNKDVQALKKVTNYLSVITGSIEEGESVEKAIRRELYEEGGVLLNNMFNIEYQGPYFKSKSHSSQVYMCVLELNINEYKQTQPPGDGTKSEELSRTIKVSLGDIDNIKSNDLFTQNLLLMLKNEYDI
jgi:8-oxo-dGTP pyrophosphatase MutT (NUDIX family)